MEPEDVTRAGEMVLAMIGTAVAVGHRSPHGLKDYAAPIDPLVDPVGAAVLDAFLARTDDAAAARLVAFADERGLVDFVANVVGRA